MRAVALALMVLALANPSFTREDRDPHPLGRRRHRRQEPEPGFRRPHAADRSRARRRWSSGSSAFPAWKCASPKRARPTARPTARGCSPRCPSTLADVPPDRVAGAIMITDGRVHDVPADAAALGFAAPLHALITGHKDEHRPPRRADADAALRHRRAVADHRLPRRGSGRARPAPREVTVRRDGEVLEQRTVAVGSRRQRRRADPACRARTSSRSKPRRSTAN